MVTRYNQMAFYTNFAVRQAAEFSAILRAQTVLAEPATTPNDRERKWLANVILQKTWGDRGGAIERFAMAISLIPNIQAKSTTNGQVDPTKLLDADFDNTVAAQWTDVAIALAPAPEPMPEPEPSPSPTPEEPLP